jgi:hypothetical protein
MKRNSECWLLSLRRAVLLVAVTLLAVTGLSSCSGGTTVNATGGGISGTGAQTLAIGSVTGFGSVIVGGVHYSAKPGATVQVDDNSAAGEADLQPGMTVVVRGSFDSASNTGSYDSIRYRSDLEGPVAGIDLLNGSFTLFGQTVQVDAATVFDGVADLATLANGALVQVSGTADDLGRLHATRVFQVRGTVGPTDTVKVKGRVTSVAAGSITVGSAAASQTVTITAQTVFDNLTQAELSATDTRLIEVTGTLPVGPSGTPLVATRIERLDSVGGAASGDRIFLRGFVVDGSAASFQLSTPNGLVTVAGAGASFKGGTSAAILVGQDLEVTGTLSGTVLNATLIEFEQQNTISVEGDVASVTGNSLVVNGVTVSITDQTLFKDSSAAGVRGLNLGSIVPGNHVRIGGTLDASVTPARVVATKLERLTTSGNAVIQGPVSRLTPGIVILGVPISVVAGSTEYVRVRGGASSLVPFSGQEVTLNSTVVKAKGTFTGPSGPLAATELEIE